MNDQPTFVFPSVTHPALLAFNYIRPLWANNIIYNLALLHTVSNFILKLETSTEISVAECIVLFFCLLKMSQYNRTIDIDILDCVRIYLCNKNKI